MVANLCLITCAFFAAQPAERSEWLLFPRLSQGQELVYHGSYAEEALDRDVQFSRSYRLESRLFVLDRTTRATDVAVYTVFRAPASASTKQIEPAPSSARLELIKVNPQGRVSGEQGLVTAIPLDGPPTLECGAFVEFPQGRISAGHVWQVAEDNRPPRVWTVIGMEMAGNTNCLRLECLQQTVDWNQPGNDRQAWRRRDTVWVSPSLGVAHKFERSIELKSLREPSQRLLVQYELQTNIQYPGRLFDDRRREILQARTFHMALAPMLPNPAHYPTRTYDAMLAKINHHIDSEPRTPYRDAILQVKRRVESARRGETPAAVGDVIPAARMAVGQAAPDFMTTNLLTKESIRLSRFLGRPVVMVFYSPNSTKAEELLRFAQRIQNAYRDTVHVVGFAISDDSEHIRQQGKDYQLTMPILSGKGLRQSYAVEATPKLIVLDADGVVRGSYDGWGPETPELVTQEVATSLTRKSGAAQREGKDLNPSGQPGR